MTRTKRRKLETSKRATALAMRARARKRPTAGRRSATQTVPPRGGQRSYERVATFDRKSLNESERTIELSISSEAPVMRWFGAEILRHSTKAVDWSYFDNTRAVLFNHDPDRIVGPVVDRWVEDKQIRVRIRFDETDEGNLRMAQVKSGSLRGASIRYTYAADGFREVGSGQTKDGVAGPARIVTRWKPIEATLTPIPADPSVGVGRNSDGGEEMKGKKKNATKPKNRRVDDDEDDPSRNEDGDEVEDDDDDDAGDEEEAPKRGKKTRKRSGSRSRRPDPVEYEVDDEDDGEDLRAEGARLERERIAGIRELATLCGDTEEARNLAAELERDGEITVEEARGRFLKLQAKQRGGTVGEPASREIEDETNYEPRIAATLGVRSWVLAGHGASQGGSKPLTVEQFRNVAGRDDFGTRCAQLFTRDKDGNWKCDPSRISLRAMYEALVGIRTKMIVMDEALGSHRAIPSSAFATFVGSASIAMVRAAYEATPRSLDQLVSSMPSSNETDDIPAVLSEPSIREVQEGREYLESGATEETVQIGHKKQGGIIRITDEMIRFDKTGQFVMRANQLGRDASDAMEKLIAYRISDSTGLDGRRVYRPDGTETALYSTTARPRGTNLKESNGLATTANLDAARALGAAMKKHNVAPKEPIGWRPEVLVIPDALVNVAFKLLNTEQDVGNANNDLNPWGPKGQWRPKIVSSQFLDLISTTDWFLGEPTKQFVKKEVIGLEMTTKGSDSELAFTADIPSQMKVRFDMEVGAIDYVWFIKNTA